MAKSIKKTQPKSPVKPQEQTQTVLESMPLQETRHLYLMRHGKASKSKKKNEDVLRPLVKRGRKDVKKIRKLMYERHVHPDLILCSPSVRTMETLEKLRKIFPPTEVVFLDSLYMADADEMMHVLRQMESDKYEVLVIGHNPGLEDFLPKICGEDEEKSEAHNHHAKEGFPTSALACLEISENWKNLDSAPVRLMNFIYSSDL